MKNVMILNRNTSDNKQLIHAANYKMKYSTNTHIKTANGELLSHFIIFLQVKTIDDGMVHLGLSQRTNKTKLR